MAAQNPIVDLDVTRDKLRRLCLDFAAEDIQTLTTEAVEAQMAPHRFLDRVLAYELGRREERRFTRALRLSGLPSGQSLADFDFAFQPSISRSVIETLATCQFIRDCTTILLQGPPGVGKTHLAVGLGIKALNNGFRVAFYRLSDLLWLMKKDKETPPQALKRRKYMSVQLLIIDEIGFEVMDREEASLFFRLVSHRYLRGSTILTTNKSVKDWPEVLAGDEVMTTAILDRLLHKSHVFNIKGRSYRLKDLDQILNNPRNNKK